MTIHKALHLRDDIDRLCVSRNVGWRALSNNENCADASIQGIEDDIKKE